MGAHRFVLVAFCTGEGIIVRIADTLQSILSSLSELLEIDSLEYNMIEWEDGERRRGWFVESRGFVEGRCPKPGLNLV